MLGFFRKPKLLINTVEKVEIERELRRLIEFFGKKDSDRLRDFDPILFFEQFEPTEESISETIGNLCDYLNIERQRIRVVFSREDVDSVSGMAMLPNQDRIDSEVEGVLDAAYRSDLTIGRNLLYESFPGEIVRILAMHRLVLSGYAQPDDPQLAFCGEVATAFFGFGLLTVNETVSCCQSTSQGYSYFSIRKLGAINSFGLGYLLATIDWIREQRAIGIEHGLRPDALMSYRRSLEFLAATGDTLLKDLDPHGTSKSIAALESILKSGTPTTILWALGEIESRSDVVRDVNQILDSLFYLLRHSDLYVRQLALHLISYSDRLDGDQIQALQKVARSNDSWSSAVATNILSMHLPFEKLEGEFARLLGRLDHAAAANAAQIANRAGQTAIKYSVDVCDRIRVALNRCDYGLGNWYTRILTSISGDAREQLQSFFGHDEELLRGSIDLLDTSHQFTELDGSPARLIQDQSAIPAWMIL